MIIFAYLPYGLAEGIKLSGGFRHLTLLVMCDSMRLYLNCFVIIHRNHVYSVCGNRDVPLHPPQPVACHPDFDAADTAYCGLHVWSVNFSVRCPFNWNVWFLLFPKVNPSPHFSLQRRVCLPSWASPSSASRTTLKYPLLFGASWVAFFFISHQCHHSVQAFPGLWCHGSVHRSWFFSAEQWTSSLCRSYWTFSETTKSPQKWCSSCGLVVRCLLDSEQARFWKEVSEILTLAGVKNIWLSRTEAKRHKKAFNFYQESLSLTSLKQQSCLKIICDVNFGLRSKSCLIEKPCLYYG